MNCFRQLHAVACVVLLLVVTTARSEDLGVLGPVYPIAESDLLDVIHARLQQKQKAGGLEAMQKEAQKRVIAAIEKPLAVTGLGKTKTPRSYYYDPSIVVADNVVDDTGHILISKGTKANPLDVMQFSQTLLFFDGTDAAQCILAQTMMKNRKGLKPILVAGSYMELMRRWKKRLYFDQHGTLVQRFSIQNVPAVVYQEGQRLRIDEIVS